MTRVSVITPTYDRKNFLDCFVYMQVYQEYPLNKMEFLVYDDSPENHEEYMRSLYDKYIRLLKKNPRDLTFRYFYSSERVPLGQKRNFLNDHATGDIITCFDDDDYYPPDKIRHMVYRMNQKNDVLLSGSTEMLIYLSRLDTIVKVGPYGPTHCTNGTLSYRREYLKNHRYVDDASKAEEKHFMEEYKNPLVQIDYRKTILCIAHDTNTVDKYKIRSTPTRLKLRDIVRDKKLLAFYKHLHK